MGKLQFHADRVVRFSQVRHPACRVTYLKQRAVWHRRRAGGPRPAAVPYRASSPCQACAMSRVAPGYTIRRRNGLIAVI